MTLQRTQKEELAEIEYRLEMLFGTPGNRTEKMRLKRRRTILRNRTSDSKYSILKGERRQATPDEDALIKVKNSVLKIFRIIGV